MIKRKHIFNLSFILSIFLFSSCFRGLIQKAYVTNPPNVCLFDSAKSTEVKMTGNFRYIENQLSYALTNKWGLQSNLFLGYRQQKGLDLGFVYYKKISDWGYFECATGYGYFNTNSNIDEGLLFGGAVLGGYGTYYSQNINCSYHKLYIQPSFFLVDEDGQVGLTLRASFPYFTKYNCSYDLRDYDGATPELGSTAYGSANIKNKFGFILEPMITIRFNGKRKNKSFFVQLGGCISDNTITKLDGYVKDGYQPNSIRKYTYATINQQFPLHANFFTNYGLEYRFGKSIKHREAQVNHFKRNKAIQYLQNKSFRRDVLIMFNNNNGRYRKIKLGKKLKLITFEGHEIKGRLIKLNDSSIVLNNRNIPSEVPIKNIKCLYSNKTILNNLVEGVIIFFAGSIVDIIMGKELETTIVLDLKIFIQIHLKK